ncbi:MAG TPA: hypothetical protein VM687_16725 [Stenotrophomonas sp.]|nr:hypothetical protein [Stenotrophomonas sp.]
MNTPDPARRWSEEDVEQLKVLISQNTPTRIIGLKLDRSEDAIYSKVSDLGLSLKPTNQSPSG